MILEQLVEKLALAQRYLEQHELDVAENLAKGISDEIEAATISIGEKERLNVRINLLLIHISLIRGNYELAIQKSQNSIQIATEYGFLDLEARAWAMAGQSYHRSDDRVKAIDCLERAISVYDKLQDKKGQALAVGFLGTCYLEVNMLVNAFDCFKQAVEIAESIDDKELLSSAYGDLSYAYSSISPEKQLEYATKVLAISQEIGNKYRTGVALSQIAAYYTDTKKHELAVETHKKALSIFQEIGDPITSAIVMCNIARDYCDMDLHQEALEYLGKAMSIFEKGQENSHKAKVLDSTARIYAAKTYSGYDLQKAEQLYLQAETILQKSNSKQYLVDLYYELSSVYEQMNRPKDSLTYYKKYHDLSKEIAGEEATKQAQLLENQRKVSEAERDRQVKLAAFKAKENILHRVLPPQIAERIAEGEEQIADYFPTVSILFADIEGFTPMTADMPAHLVVQLLNHVFSHFDHIMKKHGCEKIKTIGDGYMAVAGAPTECADHAERMAAAAMEMIQPIDLPEEIMPFIPEGKKFSIRIGIHTGSVVAGVVGEDRFVYDIYSDAVNTAARMESHGENGRIHVSAEFMKHLSNRFSQTKNTTHGIRFESRGEMEIKGKGKMKTYFLNG